MEELRARITSLDRQKAALNERINQYENKVATAEAEREQYQLECKSLMNKLKVASVNDEEINKLREENAQMLQECNSLRNDIITLRKEALNAKNNPSPSAEDAEKLTSLQQQLETANAEKVQLEQRIAKLETLLQTLHNQKSHSNCKLKYKRFLTNFIPPKSNFSRLRKRVSRLKRSSVVER